MNKNKLYIAVIAFSVLFTFSPNYGNASSSNNSTSPKDSTQVSNLLSRLETIRSMDKSDLSPKEKKEMRQEVLHIKKGLKTAGNGVYISGGALLVVIIVLIILL